MFPVFGGYRPIPVPMRWPQGWPAPQQPPLSVPQQGQGQAQANPQPQPQPQLKATEQQSQEGPWQVRRAAENMNGSPGFLPVQPVAGVGMPHGARPMWRRRRWW